MGGINQQYTGELRKRFGYSATWLPTTEVRLGDVGVLQNYEYVRVRSLGDFGIDFRERIDSATGTLEYSSGGSVSTSFKAAGDIPLAASALAQVQAGMVVSFSAENAILFRAQNCSTASIEDQGTLAHALLGLVKEGKWPDNYVVVTEVVRSERTTILGSSRSGAQIELSADSGVSAGGTDLFSGSAGMRAVRAQKMALQIVGVGGLTPLFRAWGIKRRFLQSPALVRRGGGPRLPPQRLDQDPFAPIYFDDVDYEQFG